jgi:hypothetical protein
VISVNYVYSNFNVRHEVTAKSVVFWFIIQCLLRDSPVIFRKTSCPALGSKSKTGKNQQRNFVPSFAGFLLGLLFNPEDGGGIFL